MPTIAVIGPYRVSFFSNDGVEPPHVHVQRERSLAKFWLDPVFQASASGLQARELREIERLVRQHCDEWLEAWNEYFDN